jgi:hypothetical protein
MKRQPGYSTIGIMELTVRVGLDDFSNRDKISLLIDLMRDLGITNAILENRELSEKVFKIIDTAIEKKWNK